MIPRTLDRRARAMFRAAVATFGLVAAVAPSHATSVVPLTIVDMLGHSDTIVMGQVLSVKDGFDTRGLPYTEVTLKVSDTIRGSNDGTYTFRQFGLDKPRRTADGRVYLGRPSGWPTWRRGESAIVFMYSKSGKTGFQTTVGLGQGKLSMANGKAMNAYGNTRLFDGVGEMIELVATHFAARTPKALAVANRTLERGEKLAGRFGAEALRLSDLPNRLAEFDIVVSCTASTLPIIGLGAVERAIKARKRRPMFMVDLAVPRDIEPEVARLSDVYLYTVDDLSALVQTAGEKRQAAVEQAEAIIESGVQGFEHWLGEREAVPLIKALHQQADDWRHAEIARARKMLSKGADVDAVLEALTRGLTQKMLHGTMAELHSADATQRAQLVHTVSKLFLRQTPRDPADESR